MRNTYLLAASFLMVASTGNTVWAEDALPAATAQAAAIAPQVSRSAFTTGISNREPVDQLARISAGQEIHYFTELTGLQGHIITHRWEKDGAFQLGLQFPVAGERWRVHSSKNINANLPGAWTVTILNDDGAILKQETLVVDPVVTSEEPAQQPGTTTAPKPPAASATGPIWENLAR